MGLKEIAAKGVETTFKVFKDAVKDGLYIVETDDGWGTTSSQSDEIRIILDRFRQEDLESTSFYELIQPTDSKGLVPGKDLNLTVKASNIIQIGERKFTLVAFETDPFEALYTLLLRDTK